MRQCDLEEVIREKGNPKLKRTGVKINSFVDGISEGMEGDIIELKKIKGLWVIDKVHDKEMFIHTVKRNWSVSEV